MRQVLTCCIVLISVLSWPWSTTQAQCPGSCPERRTISVTATGLATADADLAIVRVGYKLYGEDAKSAYAGASKASNDIMQALIAAGVAKTSIESSSQILQHTQPYELQQVPIGSEERLRRQFTVAQSWVIRVRPDDASKVLNTAINAGANESGWIQWIIQNPSVLEAQASAKALADARMIAGQMAQKLDVHLGHLVSANENQNGGFGNGPINGAIGGVMGGIGSGTGMGQGASQPLAINSRRVDFNVTVFAVFAIE